MHHVVPTIGRNESAYQPAASPTREAAHAELDDSKSTARNDKSCRLSGMPEELLSGFGLNRGPMGLAAIQVIPGRRRRVKVAEIRPHSAIGGGNPPLAGNDIELEVTLISLNSSSDVNRGQPQLNVGGESKSFPRGLAEQVLTAGR